MSTRIYTTANGKKINLDSIIAKNENEIAVGNMKVNARGDELGPGGKIERTREKVMTEYYKLNTPVASDHVPTPRESPKKDLIDDWVEPLIVKEELESDQIETPNVKPLRGSLASSIAETKNPIPEPKKTGPTRI